MSNYTQQAKPDLTMKEVEEILDVLKRNIGTANDDSVLVSDCIAGSLIEASPPQKPESEEVWSCGYCGQSGGNRRFMENHKCVTKVEEKEWREVAEYVGEKTDWNFDDLVYEGEIFIHKAIASAVKKERERVLKELAEVTVYAVDVSLGIHPHYEHALLYKKVKEVIQPK